MIFSSKIQNIQNHSNLFKIDLQLIELLFFILNRFTLLCNNYKEITAELITTKTIHAADIYDYNEDPIVDIFERYFQYCKKALSEYSNEISRGSSVHLNGSQDYNR